IDYWQKQHDLVTGNSKEDIKLREQMMLKRAAAQHALDGDLKKSAQIGVQIDREAQLESIDVEKQAIEERRGLREIDATTAEEQLLALSQRSLEIKLTSLNEEYEAAEGDVVKQATIWKQMEAAQRAHGRESAKISKQTTLEIAQDWNSMFDSFSRGFMDALREAARAGEGFKGLWHNLMREMVTSAIGAGVTMLQHHLATSMAKRGITTSEAAHRVATESWAALKSVALNAWAAIQNIASYAAQAAAAAWAAISAIPIVGPFLAPVVAGAALAGVFALGSHVASAAGGYDIPAGINPMTQLHAQEMVLPAELANQVRAMAGGGGGSGGGGGQTVVHIHAMDAQSFRDFARRNPDGFGDGVAAAIGNNHSGLSKAMRGRA
ncbi:MAG: hypothetical protein JWN44_6485, partial [Myxococcales bacterium]|nr:hypothetical protein [Myxococcales bacterium]